MSCRADPGTWAKLAARVNPRATDAEINRVTSAVIRSVGRRRGTFGYGMSSNKYHRFSVFTKRNRSAETWSFTVRGSRFRSQADGGNLW
jgi:hypothetical protein